MLLVADTFGKILFFSLSPIPISLTPGWHVTAQSQDHRLLLLLLKKTSNSLAPPSLHPSLSPTQTQMHKQT